MQITSTAIAIAASKGGVGKTTCSLNLAVTAARDCRVATIDMEPQQSLARLFELRGRYVDKDPMNPRLWLGKGNPHELMNPVIEVPRLKQMGTDVIFVDLPPGDFDIIRPGVAACDFALIPCKASPIDLEAMGPILQVCEEEGIDYRVLFTMYEPGWSVSKSAFAYMERLRPGKTLPVTMNQRQAYVGSAISGHAGSEYRSDRRQAEAAASELEIIWAQVRKLAVAAATTTHSGVPADVRTRIGVSDGTVRLSIGIEHPDDLLADLSQALIAN